MNIKLNGKNALVGGSTKGLGLAIAKQLAECGANVTLMARNEDELKIRLTELSTADHQKHEYLVVDFNDFEAAKTSISQFFENHNIDILVNNTNGPKPGTVLEKSLSDYQEAFNLLFQIHNHTTQLALPNMIKNKWGRIINVSSSSVKEPINNLGLSNTIRTALVSWSKSLSQNIAQHNITVNSILTGTFDTERIHQLNKSQAEKEGISEQVVLQKRIDAIPAKRLGKPEEYGYLAAFLASDYAAYLTGATIPLDGGNMKSIL